MKKGLVSYDPEHAERFAGGAFRFHHLPERQHRPGTWNVHENGVEGLFLRHASCPFDGEEFQRQRVLARLERDGRAYDIVCNRYPVTPSHFLGVRPWEPQERGLGQYLQGEEEIEDMLLALHTVGAPYRVYFNSNRGRDGSSSGSSVNHWHFQMFPYPPARPTMLVAGGPDRGFATGTIGDWPASHVFVQGTLAHLARAAAEIWGGVQALNRENVAYNFEAVAFPTGYFRAFLFPRCPAPRELTETIRELGLSFGGWELSGDVVVGTGELYVSLKSRPEEAAELAAARLRATTRPLRSGRNEGCGHCEPVH